MIDVKGLVAPYEPTIKACSDKYAIDADVVRAIIVKESAGNPWEVRVEPAWKYFYFVREHSSRLGISFSTETICQSMSWGLMQIMGSVAREYEFSDLLTKLLTPENAIEYGSRHLKKMFVRYGNEMDAISAYNAGSVLKTIGGMYGNELYVDETSQYLRAFRQITV